MTVRQIYEFAIERGMELDPRGRQALEEQLAGRRRHYEELEGPDKESFDVERLTNPFGDSRIVAGDPDTEVRGLLAGIDITGAEIILAHTLRERGEPVDACWSHHPGGLGRGMANIEDTIWLQVHEMTEAGVPRHAAEKLVRADMEERKPGADFRHVQVAEALDIPVFTLHGTPDLYNLKYIRTLVDRAEPQTLGDLVDLIQHIPECRWLRERGTPVTVPAGDRRDPPGRVYYAMAGGWNPSPASFEALCQAGVGTFVLLETTDQFNELARKHHASIIRYPHWQGDSVGMNLLIDDLCRESPIRIVPTSNFIRIEREEPPF